MDKFVRKMDNGNFFYARNKYVLAEKAYAKAIDINGASAEAHYHIGQTILAQRRMAEAKIAFDKSASVNWAFVQAQMCRIQIRVYLNDIEEAKVILKNTLNLSKKFPSLYTGLIQIVELMNWSEGWDIIYEHYRSDQNDIVKICSLNLYTKMRSMFLKNNTLKDKFLYVVVVPVWGQRHTEIFLNVSLPTLLSSGNLPHLTKKGARFRLGTSEKDFQIIRKHRSFIELSRIMPIDVDIFDSAIPYSSYERMTYIHNRAIAYYSYVDAAYIFINSDTVFGNKSLKHADKTLSGGARAVMVLGIRCDMDLFLQNLRQTAFSKISSLSNRELMKIALNSLHPMQLGHRWTESGSEEDGHYFKSTTEALIFKCFHLHPTVLKINKNTRRFVDTTIDHDFVRTIVDDFQYVHVVTDSDDMAVIEISPTNYRTSTKRVPSIKRTLAFASDWASEFHRRFAEKVIILHSHGVSDDTRDLAITFGRQFKLAVLDPLENMAATRKFKGMYYKRNIGCRFP